KKSLKKEKGRRTPHKRSSLEKFSFCPARSITGTVWIGTLNPKVSKGDYASYINTARQVNDSKGVAAFLWASLEMEEMTAQ
ncbi:MAG: hypothetical protein L0229_11910, partial [Blastocatellia bacterium]|nr:hypothetical protein [Blastocatellia bacterium]